METRSKLAGLAKITGGRYRIGDWEGRAIAKFTPPPILENIDWDSLKPSQQWLLDEFEAHWQIVAHWLVYYRAAGVDIKQSPFTLPEFQDKRPLAELYNSQLELCREIWEFLEIRQYYPTPYHWWEDCIVELQNAQVSSILASGGSEINTPLKGQVEDGLRRLLRNLKAGEVPFEESASNTHLYRLYATASCIRKQSPKVRNAWKNYLASLNNYVKALKNNSDIKAVVHLGWRLYYQGAKNQLIPILPQGIKSNS